MSFLITGGTGFVGSHVTRELVKRKQKVIIFDYLPNVEAINDVKNKVEIVRGDVLDLAGAAARQENLEVVGQCATPCPLQAQIH